MYTRVESFNQKFEKKEKIELTVRAINVVIKKQFYGDVAQLEEHHNGIVGVVGSNPIISIYRI